MHQEIQNTAAHQREANCQVQDVTQRPGSHGEPMESPSRLIPRIPARELSIAKAKAREAKPKGTLEDVESTTAQGFR